MADAEEIFGLRGQRAVDKWLEGRDAWNAWVDEHPEEEISFSGFDFTKYEKISFQRFQFSDGGTDFSGATFGANNVDFSNTTFGVGGVSFRGAKFGAGDINFQGARFADGDVSF